MNTQSSHKLDWFTKNQNFQSTQSTCVDLIVMVSESQLQKVRLREP
jgi:hypothetical protein